ncbi:MAG: glycerophosphodiester phosphodiesterase [Promethearchaeota archaeon]
MASQIVIAHKGASAYAPENTLLSFRRAYELGAQMIELDVHETLDGQLVCIHDKTVDRTTDGSGEVRNFSYEELMKMDAGDGERIPLLEDVLTFASGKLQVNIELKVIGVEMEVLDLVEKTGMNDSIVISSFLHGALSTIKEISSNSATAILIKDKMNDLVQYAVDLEVNAINPDHKLVSTDLVKDAQMHTLRVYPWTVNDTVTMKRLFGIGVDGIITDYPDVALDILRSSI